MACPCSARFSCDFRVYNIHGCRVGHHHMNGSSRLHLVGINESLKQESVTLRQLCTMWVPIKRVPSRCDVLVCRSVLIPRGGSAIALLKSATVALTRLCDTLQQSPIVLQLIPAVGIITFSSWGLGPLLRLGRILFLQRTDSSWNESRSHYVMTSYLQPLLLWTGVILICRALDPVVLPSEASQAVKQRLLNFVRSLSTVLAFAFCLSSLIQQVQKFFQETNDSNPRNMGFDFAGKAMYTAVWVAAVSSFMELLGFSAQKWLTAGGLGTVLLTLAGREIFTNFLSSIMIHATRPFAVDEWIQTKIQGYEVSGTVEHVGWWSPTIVRGDDREAVHIPNHKFTVNVVRNLSQKSHWRIKNYIAINYLDVKKINIIVADMRKVLAKNPQVEQQKLHRRVFLENINPENQALVILISCFVKTSRFEEYLYVKEGILLDLLRVVSHHGARLATPIRTVHKMYSETEMENEPSDDTISTRSSGATHRPLLLAESAYKINGEDRVNTSTHPKEKNEEKDPEIDESLILGSKSERKTGPVRDSDLQNDDTAARPTASTPSSSTKLKSGFGTQAQKLGFDDSVSKSSKLVEPKNDGSRDIVEETFGAASTELPQNVPVPGQGETLSAIQQAKQEDDKSVLAPSSPRPSFEDNLVLGVALEGSKRTLPIDEEINTTPFSSESKGFANQERGASRPPPGDKKDGHAPNPSMKKND